LIPVSDKHAARPLWGSVVIFLASFFVLQLGWTQARGTFLERWVIDYATVRTSVAVVNALTPQADAVALGASILSPGGGVTVRNGCEGTEVLFLLIAAILCYPFSWGMRLAGAVAGLLFVFVINQVRLVALFYAVRTDSPLFGPLHGVVAPLVLILCTLIFFVALISWGQARRREPP
jgi:exosortase/archaeosortase family protein